MNNSNMNGSQFLFPMATLAAAASPANAEAMSIRLEPKDDLSRVPQPMHRHAAPSAPWPWVDLDDDVDRQQLDNPDAPIPPLCDHGSNCNRCWTGYPQSRFPNWTYRQVVKSKIHRALTEYNTSKDCTCYRVDVDTNGRFTNAGNVVAEHDKDDEFWESLVHEKRPNNLRVRAIFIDNMSGPVLKMFGAKYNIEPFFWSSSLNWIPSRFQEEIKRGVGDHITVTLTFLKSMSLEDAEKRRNENFSKSNVTLQNPSTYLGSQNIDTQAPLILHSNKRILVLDLLAVHLIRNVNGSTLISFHPTMELPTTPADFLHTRIRFAGQSVYWQNIFQNSPDPTFLLLTFVWHAVYAWDEALENLYTHICSLETRVISTSEMPLTQELHVIRAHHLHYTSLLDDFTKHVHFIQETHNPLMDNLSQDDRKFNAGIMKRECDNLLTEIKRLSSELHMQERRLKNVMGLVFSSVNITDSRYMREMTEAAVRDSAAMKQVAYLTMAFLPASFVAGVFGMNVSEINPGTFGSLAHYVEVALPLTLLTAWIMVAFQSAYIIPDGTSFFARLWWPVFLVKSMLPQKPKAEEAQQSTMFGRPGGPNSFAGSKEDFADFIDIQSPTSEHHRQ
ncbi:hypothetical protein CPB83DRAFT_850531 [Crepidotus variabilis]|uniref:Uncharacterized protein n=1 Tax=Crepidotus variabilis TaxID=179855 RepID=A0A9P6JS55_9AGAR|nr:hypothetical protein CPB83DRAFT_850531 [Crepidotus variabilis]